MVFLIREFHTVQRDLKANNNNLLDFSQIFVVFLLAAVLRSWHFNKGWLWQKLSRLHLEATRRALTEQKWFRHTVAPFLNFHMWLWYFRKKNIKADGSGALGIFTHYPVQKTCIICNLQYCAQVFSHPSFLYINI